MKKYFNPATTSFYRRFFGVWLGAIMPLLLANHTARADAIDWPTLRFSQLGTNTFSMPVIITHAGDGSGRLFIGEQWGHIKITQGTNVLATPFLDISDRVAIEGAEQGLLGLAFPPGFSTNQHFYVDYTRPVGGAVVISRFNVSTTNANVADPNSEQILTVIAKPIPQNNHNGGQIAFGPDGFLYIGVGDGGSEGDPQNFGQTTSTLLGKLLRINVESGASPYAVPTNNPFVGNTHYAPEIWATGLRNPWRFSFDRVTGDLYIGDVGQNTYEEVDFQPAGSAGGQNYGWRIMEGPTNYIVPSGFTNFSALTWPVVWYSHASLPTDFSAAVIGGYVYRGPDAPRLNGMYFYGDFVAGWIWGLKQSGTNWENVVLSTNNSHQISTFGEDEAGQIYFADYGQGKIYQLQDSGQAWAPTFLATNGIINSAFVGVSCLTTGAVIHYTSNNIDPTESDPVVAIDGTIPVTVGPTYKIRAYRADLTPSPVTAATFATQAGTPTFTPPAGAITNKTPVSITTVTPNAVIYYTTNGALPTTNSHVYTKPIVLSGGNTLEALAVAAGGYGNSIIAIGSYATILVDTPTFSLAAGPITNQTKVSIAIITPHATIHYTTSGRTPTAGSTIYSRPVTLSGNVTLQAIGIAKNYSNSVVASVTYSAAQTATPVFTPASGPITNGTMFSISCATPGRTIYFTTNSRVPNHSSHKYSKPFLMNGGIIVSALASAKGYIDSSLETVLYQSVAAQFDSANNFVTKISPGVPTLPESWQIAHFGHTGVDPNDDPDHDGMSNYAEYLAGTDPVNPNSYFAIKSLVILEGGHAEIRWQSIEGRTYTVLYSDDFLTWHALGAPVKGDGSMFSTTDPTSMQEASHRSYRVYLTY
jgi:glucose/arabinose dehydrogenase